MPERKSVFCTCCGTEILAEIAPGKVIIVTRRHGQKHTCVINKDEIPDKECK